MRIARIVHEQRNEARLDRFPSFFYENAGGRSCTVEARLKKIRGESLFTDFRLNTGVAVLFFFFLSLFYSHTGRKKYHEYYSILDRK